MKHLRLLLFLCLLIFQSDAISTPSTTLPTAPPRLEDRVLDKSNVKPYEITSFTLCHATEKEFGQEGRSVNSSLLGYLGFSYDPLTDVSFYPIFDESFSECSKTPDGRFYIPNGYVVEDIGNMVYWKNLRLVEDFKSATTDTSASGSAGGSSNKGVAASGSANFQHIKKEMDKKSRSMFIIVGSNVMYQLSGTFATPFTPSFMRKIERAIKFKNKGRHEAALYVMQKVVADYGTDVTVEATIGTFFEHRAYVESSAVTTTTERKAAVQAKAAAKLKQGAGSGAGGASYDSSDTEGESDVDMTFETWASGGPALKKYFEKKEVNLFDDSYPIALNRRKASIGLMMEGGSLGDKSYNIQHAMRRLFDDAANEYFERNTFEGCTDSKRANFDYQANVNDNSCSNEEYCTEATDVPEECKSIRGLLAETNETLRNEANEQFENCRQKYKFVNIGGYLIMQGCGGNKLSSSNLIKGGIYQTCETNEQTTKLTEELKKLDKDRPDPCTKLNVSFLTYKGCPSGLEAYSIINYTYVVPDSNIVYEKSICSQKNEYYCATVRAEITLREKVTIKSYWCRPTNYPKSYSSIGFYGYFDPEQPNNFNGQSACSHGSDTVVFFHHTTLCLKAASMKPNENENEAELTFLYSHKDLKIGCPNMHSRQLITVVNGEKIYGCILKKQAYYNLDTPEILKGPYVEERVTDKDHGRSFMIIKKNGRYKQKYYLESHGNNIMNQIDEYVRRLKQYSDKSSENGERVKKESAIDFIKSNYIVIIITTVLIIVCIVACCVYLKSVRKP